MVKCEGISFLCLLSVLNPPKLTVIQLLDPLVHGRSSAVIIYWCSILQLHQPRFTVCVRTNDATFCLFFFFLSPLYWQDTPASVFMFIFVSSRSSVQCFMRQLPAVKTR